MFAQLAMEHPHILLLDEPTNHLDMASIDALAQAIKEYEGGVVIVSHDFRTCSHLHPFAWLSKKPARPRPLLFACLCGVWEARRGPRLPAAYSHGRRTPRSCASSGTCASASAPASPDGPIRPPGGSYFFVSLFILLVRVRRLANVCVRGVPFAFAVASSSMQG